MISLLLFLHPGSEFTRNGIRSNWSPFTSYNERNSISFHTFCAYDMYYFFGFTSILSVAKTFIYIFKIDFYILHLCCPNGISRMGNSGCLPLGKLAATESRHPISVRAGYFSLSVTHRTLTRTTGPLTCAQV